MPKLNHLFLDRTDYAAALQLQETLFEAQLEKLKAEKPTTNTLIYLQHDPVYTLGKSGDEANLKVSVEESGAAYYQTSRGGDITYHGPGQLTAYPIFNLADFGMGVREYVETLEQCVIDCLAEYGLKAERLAGASGVWLDAKNEKARKICAIGIKVSRGICMHGLAFNINTDLSYFDNIVPCGIDDKGVTSLANELGEEQDFWQVCEKLIGQFENSFN
ncbi:MAG: lipoyl(octanoyl) transferase LipB [Vicingaceae bacterium]